MDIADNPNQEMIEKNIQEEQETQSDLPDTFITLEDQTLEKQSTKSKNSDVEKLDDTPSNVEESDSDLQAKSGAQGMPFPSRFATPIKEMFMALHNIFKMAQVFLFFFGWLISDNNITIFALVLICIVFDFWVVKNLTGRKILRMRWWTLIGEDGNEKWYFECDMDFKGDSSIDKKNCRVFWISQISIASFWLAVVVIDLSSLGFFWSTLAIIGFGLSSFNVYGYFMCRKAHSQSLRKAISGGFSTLRNKLIAGYVSNMLNSSRS